MSPDTNANETVIGLGKHSKKKKKKKPSKKRKGMVSTQVFISLNQKKKGKRNKVRNKVIKKINQYCLKIHNKRLTNKIH